MPNWSLNTLTVYGSPSEISRFAEDVTGAGDDETMLELDFSRHVPEPSGLTGSDLNDWRTRAWGTKWLADVSDVSRPSPEGLIYEFSTAWSPPLPWLRGVAPRYPELSFELFYEVEAGDLLGRTLRIRGATEVGGYALVNSSQFAWEQCGPAIDRVTSADESIAHISLTGATDAGADATELIRGYQWGDREATEDELAAAISALRDQLRTDLQLIASAIANALTAPAPRHGGTATSYLIGTRPEAEWRGELSRLTEQLREFETSDLPGALDSAMFIEAAINLVEQTVPEVGGALSRLAGCDVLRHAWPE